MSFSHLGIHCTCMYAVVCGYCVFLLQLYRFGHQDSVSAIDCMHRERPISAGMNDRTVRIWKVAEESQLVFHGHKYVY